MRNYIRIAGRMIADAIDKEIINSMIKPVDPLEIAIVDEILKRRLEKFKDQPQNLKSIINQFIEFKKDKLIRSFKCTDLVEDPLSLCWNIIFVVVGKDYMGTWHQFKFTDNSMDYTVKPDIIDYINQQGTTNV